MSLSLLAAGNVTAVRVECASSGDEFPSVYSSRVRAC